MLLAIYRTARHYIPVDCSLIIHCHQNLKYHTKLFLLAFLQLCETGCSYSWRIWTFVQRTDTSWYKTRHWHSAFTGMTSIVRYLWHTRVRDIFHSQSNGLGEGKCSLCIVVDSAPGEYSMINSVLCSPSFWTTTRTVLLLWRRMIPPWDHSECRDDVWGFRFRS